MLRVCKPLVQCGLLLLLFCSPVAGQQKAKVPDAEAQAKSLALVKQIFAEEFGGAKTALLKSALAKKMLDQAFDITKATSDKFVLLRVARDMAVMAGDHQTSIAAVVETARQFQVDEIRTTASVLAKLSKTVHSVEDN